MSAECVRFVDGPFFLNDSGLTVESKLNQLTQVYLDWFLFGNQDLIYSIGKGSAQKNLDMKEFADIQIPLPPIEVQKEIVERLEKELGEADKVTAEFKRITETVSNLRKAILSEAFE
jgi:restriction endonuclease S subunit